MSAECLPDIHKVLSSVSSTTQKWHGRIRLKSWHLETWRQESEVQSYPWLHGEFKASLGYMRQSQKEGMKGERQPWGRIQGCLFGHMLLNAI